MKENCATCKADYDVTPENAGVVIFLAYLPASHVLATCSNCKTIEIIYCTPGALVDLTKDRRFVIVIKADPPEERRTAADVTWARHQAARSETEAAEPEPAEPEPMESEPPREWLRQLHDDLRSFGRGWSE